MLPCCGLTPHTRLHCPPFHFSFPFNLSCSREENRFAPCLSWSAQVRPDQVTSGTRWSTTASLRSPWRSGTSMQTLGLQLPCLCAPARPGFHRTVTDWPEPPAVTPPWLPPLSLRYGGEQHLNSPSCPSFPGDLHWQTIVIYGCLCWSRGLPPRFPAVAVCPAVIVGNARPGESADGPMV